LLPAVVIVSGPLPPLALLVALPVPPLADWPRDALLRVPSSGDAARLGGDRLSTAGALFVTTEGALARLSVLGRAAKPPAISGDAMPGVFPVDIERYGARLPGGGDRGGSFIGASPSK
jgi:hypothetical protein